VTAVLANRFDLIGIWRGWIDRKHYATTGERILVDFQCGDVLMGGEMETNSPPSFSARVYGTAPVARLELARGNRVIRTWEPGSHDVVTEWTDKEPVSGTSPYYVRVTQTNDSLAWSSPIYVTYTGEMTDRSVSNELPMWNDAIWPEEIGAQHDTEIEEQAVALLCRRSETLDVFQDLRAAGIYEDVRGRYVLIRARREGTPIQWNIYYEFPDWRISGKPGSWNTHG
jgi:hypothetical protein